MLLWIFAIHTINASIMFSFPSQEMCEKRRDYATKYISEHHPTWTLDTECFQSNSPATIIHHD